MAFWNRDKTDQAAGNNGDKPQTPPPPGQSTPQAAASPPPPQAQAATNGTQAQSPPQPGQTSNRKAHPGAVFGEIVTILMRSPQYQTLTLKDLEWMVLPALQHNQFHLALDQTKAQNFPASVGVALWAYVSPEVDQRLSTNLHEPVRLMPAEWNSGEILWLIDAVGTAPATLQLMQGLGQSAFKGKTFKMRSANEAGQTFVKTVQPGA